MPANTLFALGWKSAASHSACPQFGLSLHFGVPPIALQLKKFNAVPRVAKHMYVACRCKLIQLAVVLCVLGKYSRVCRSTPADSWNKLVLMAATATVVLEFNQVAPTTKLRIRPVQHLSWPRYKHITYSYY